MPQQFAVAPSPLPVANTMWPNKFLAPDAGPSGVAAPAMVLSTNHATLAGRLQVAPTIMAISNPNLNAASTCSGAWQRGGGAATQSSTSCACAQLDLGQSRGPRPHESRNGRWVKRVRMSDAEVLVIPISPKPHYRQLRITSAPDRRAWSRTRSWRVGGTYWQCL
jgi:hypothetical protein